MIITVTEKQISEICADWRANGFSIGFVPTMGALHKGHLSLIELAKKNCDKVVVSIFVNSTQFAPDEDLDKYPRTFEQDCKKIEEACGDAVFAPEDATIYPSDFSTQVSVGNLTNGLCGAERPGHFDGVTTVCAVLFGIVKPDVAVFGMKDAQQLAVIRQMVKDLRLGIKIIGAPIVRENDGIALSSRNAYLSEKERANALFINKGLLSVLNLVKSGEQDSTILKIGFLQTLKNAPVLNVQYAEIVDIVTLKKVEKVEETCLMAVAVFAGKTRLIDNIVLEPEVRID